MVLDEVLYGCVEAVALWHANLCATMRGDRFVPNPYGPCVINKQGPKCVHITVLVHIDDLFITSTGNDNHMRFEKCMRDKYKEIKIIIGKVVDYIGMPFDFIVPRQVSITLWTTASAPYFPSAGFGR